MRAFLRPMILVSALAITSNCSQEHTSHIKIQKQWDLVRSAVTESTKSVEEIKSTLLSMLKPCLPPYKAAYSSSFFLRVYVLPHSTRALSESLHMYSHVYSLVPDERK